MPAASSLIFTLIMIFGAAFIGGLISHKLKIPLLVGYIISGLVVGNLFPGYLHREFVGSVSEIGVTLLLFVLGVEFSFHRVVGTLRRFFPLVLLQIIITVIAVFCCLMWLKLPTIFAVVLAIAASLSSTAVTVKILTERGELDTLPGENASLWLVIQDLLVIPLMIALPFIKLFTGNTVYQRTEILSLFGFNLSKSVLVLMAIIIAGKFILPLILKKIADLGSRELLLLLVVAIVFLSSIATGAIGLSMALGAFISGLFIADTRENHAVFSEVRPLRDIFAVIFFTAIGLLLPLKNIFLYGHLLIIIPALIFIIKFTIIILLMRFKGSHRKTAFIVGLCLLPMSEFGFILAKEAFSLSIISYNQYYFLMAVTFITIVISTPIIARQHQIYYLFDHIFGKRLPKIFKVKLKENSYVDDLPLENHIVLCGFGRVGKYIGRALEMSDIPFIVIEYNLSSVKKLKLDKTPVIYGDPGEIDVLDYAQVDYAKAIVIAIPDKHTQELVIKNSLVLNPKIKIFCRTHFEENQHYLKNLGVHTVIQPEFEASIAISSKILYDYGKPKEDISRKISRLKIEHGLG